MLDKILKYSSLSIVGTDKNTGKTECLNYILRGLRDRDKNKQIAVTSIGLDGERKDIVTATSKPEITIYEGMLFATGEKYYRQRRLTAEVVGVSRESTAAGRIVTARALSDGKVMLAGPSDNARLRRWTDEVRRENGAALCVVDGALSRMSSASPAVSEAMILATGAASAANIPALVARTGFVCDLIERPLVDSPHAERMARITRGVWVIGDDGRLHDSGIQSLFALDKGHCDMFRFGTRFFVPGVLNNRFLQHLMRNCQVDLTEVVVPDFTNIFVEPAVYYDYTGRGGRISVLQRPRLIAVCVNPTSPSGYVLNSDKLVGALQAVLKVPVYNIREAMPCD